MMIKDYLYGVVKVDSRAKNALQRHQNVIIVREKDILKRLALSKVSFKINATLKMLFMFLIMTPVMVNINIHMLENMNTHMTLAWTWHDLY